MPEQRRIAVVTATRAEYGILVPLMRAIEAEPSLCLQVVATGAHLSPSLGETWRQIHADGFVVSSKVDMLLANDTGVAATKAVGLGAIGLADAFERLRPDLVVVLGDRYELLAVASAALLLRIPLLHLHGGERTEGAFDEAIRHAVTKLAALHGVATEMFRRRVLQLGEPADRVHVVGTLAIDAMAATPLLPTEALAADIDLALDRPFLVATWHPETTSADNGASGLNALLKALDRRPDLGVLFTLPNADPGNSTVRSAVENWVAERPQRARAVANLGAQRYWSAIAGASAVIGNSSSGLIEVPHLGTPTVNIGFRQHGRPRAPSVIDCDSKADAIHDALNLALSDAHRELASKRQSPYGGRGAAARIVDLIKTAPLASLATKQFRDLELDP